MTTEGGGGRHEWLEYPELIDEQQLPYLVEAFDEAGVAYRTRPMTRPALSEYWHETEHELHIRADHGRRAGRILARIFRVVDPRAETAQSGTCPACGGRIVDALRCPECGINVGSTHEEDDPVVGFIREVGGFVDEDRERLAELAEAGVDLARPVEVGVALWTEDERSPETVAAAARDTGCDVEVEPVDDGWWRCWCTRRMVATYDAVTALQDELAEIAGTHDARISPWYVDEVATRLEQWASVAGDAEGPVRFEFRAELDDERAANELWSTAKGLGIRARVERGEDATWACVCEQRLPADADAVREAMASIEELCDRFGGRLASWGPADEGPE